MIKGDDVQCSTMTICSNNWYYKTNALIENLQPAKMNNWICTSTLKNFMKVCCIMQNLFNMTSNDHILYEADSLQPCLKLNINECKEYN